MRASRSDKSIFAEPEADWLKLYHLSAGMFGYVLRYTVHTGMIGLRCVRSRWDTDHGDRCEYTHTSSRVSTCRDATSLLI